MKNSKTELPSQVDLRGFRYALEPLQTKRQWHLNALQAQLGREQQRLGERRQTLKAQQGEHRDQSHLASAAMRVHLDPIVHQRALAYLARLHGTIQESQGILNELQIQCDNTKKECVEQQCKVEVLEQHRRDQLRDYAADMTAKQAAEADRDWVARTQWLSKSFGLPTTSLPQEHPA